MQEVETHRELELARLNSLQVALWPKAMQGLSLAAAHQCLKLIIARCRLLGLYEEPRKAPKDRWDNCQGPPTVVVRGDDCRHHGCDKHGLF